MGQPGERAGRPLPRVGRRFAHRYRIEGPGRPAGYATAYPALDERSGQRVTVLLVHERALATFVPDALPAALHNARRVGHPALVSIIDGSSAPSGPTYLVRQLREARTLDSMLAGGPIGREVLLAVFVDIADALAALHAARLPHGDVRARNIVVDRTASGETVARLVGAESGTLFRPETAAEREATFGVGGSASPEQLWNAPSGSASDVYALGLTLLETLTGARVHPGRTVADVAARVPSTVRLPAGLDPVLAELIGRMTAIDPRRRPSAAHVCRVLTAAAAPHVAVPKLSLAGLGIVPEWRPPRLPRARDVIALIDLPPLSKRAARRMSVGALGLAAALLVPVLIGLTPLSSAGTANAAPAAVLAARASTGSPAAVGEAAPSAGATVQRDASRAATARVSIAAIVAAAAVDSPSDALPAIPRAAVAPSVPTAVPMTAVPMTAVPLAPSPTPAAPAPVAPPTVTLAAGPAAAQASTVASASVVATIAPTPTTPTTAASATPTASQTPAPAETATPTASPTPPTKPAATPTPTPDPTSSAIPSPPVTPTAPATPAATPAPTGAPSPDPAPTIAPTSSPTPGG